MQVLSAQCPYCHHSVETTLEHLDSPIVCPSCHKPFEMEVPRVAVSSVREVSRSSAEASKNRAAEVGEQTLKVVHPAVFRARPVASVIMLAVLATALVGLWWSFLGSGRTVDLASDVPVTDNGIALPVVIAWVSILTMVAIAGIIAYWLFVSHYTTLTITDRRTVVRRGFISRQSSEVQHDDIRNIQVNQNLPERLMGIGDIGISSSGQDDLEIVITKIPDPGGVVALVRDNQA